METQAPEIKMDVKTLLETTTSFRVSELRELEEYFFVLEKNRRNLQYLLQEQKEDHEMALKTQERKRIQERMEWERQMREREETLQSAFMSVAISRQKMMKDLMARMSTTSLKYMDETSGSGHIITSPVVPQGAIHLGGTARKQPRKWWFLLCCSCHAASEDANSSSATADKKMADLQLIAKLEERVRKAETKKQQKALKKAEEQAKKAEKKAIKAEKKRAKKEGKRAGNKDDEVKGNSSKQFLSSVTKE
ncbi:uncharacterized protein LOC121685020 [Alosa sapidissima]|uniref:uncharacterized protein LOC121685020 n=1 Tax=Alosa sapidissima TaxID=34773 RepID=UPI001C08123B|nr:uncharacterized protein LOC121685020 [Alosa sapidissima]